MVVVRGGHLVFPLALSSGCIPGDLRLSHDPSVITARRPRPSLKARGFTDIHIYSYTHICTPAVLFISVARRIAISSMPGVGEKYRRYLERRARGPRVKVFLLS